MPYHSLLSVYRLSVQASTLHGFAGYFDSRLFGDFYISIVPKTFSEVCMYIRHVPWSIQLCELASNGRILVQIYWQGRVVQPDGGQRCQYTRDNMVVPCTDVDMDAYVALRQRMHDCNTLYAVPVLVAAYCMECAAGPALPTPTAPRFPLVHKKSFLYCSDS